MPKVKRITENKTVGYSYVTKDLVHFEYKVETEQLETYLTGDITPIKIDMTEETSFMLMEFFRYVNQEIKDKKNGKIKEKTYREK